MKVNNTNSTVINEKSDSSMSLSEIILTIFGTVCFAILIIGITVWSVI